MTYRVELLRQPIFAVIDLKGAEPDLKNWIDSPNVVFPSRPNSRTHFDGVELFRIGEEHWLMRAELDQEDRLMVLTRLERAPVHISIVLVSDTLTFSRISGPDADQIIKIACPLDIHPTVFPCDSSSYTQVFGIKGLVIRNKDGFEIAVESSYADMIDDFLRRATA